MELLLLVVIDIGFIYRIIKLMNENKLRCHRLKSRCLPIMRDRPWRICSRCLFIYIGIVCYPLVYIVLKPTGVHIFASLLLVVMMQVPMLADGLSQRFSARKSNNWLRSLTGFIAGLGLSVLICTLIFIGGY